MAKNSMRIFWNHRTFLQTSFFKKEERLFTALWSPAGERVFYLPWRKISNWSCEEPRTHFENLDMGPSHPWTCGSQQFPEVSMVAACLSSAAWLIWACLSVFPWPPLLCISGLAPAMLLPSPQVPGSLSLITTFLQLGGFLLHILYILRFLLKCHFLPKIPRIHLWYRLPTL